MIERYSRPAMREIWSDRRRLERWLDVELAVVEAREADGEVAVGSAADLRSRIRIDPARMEAIEADVHHDVIAFLTMVGETGGEASRHLHAGMTSSDLVDTALALQMAEAGTLLRDGLATVRRRAYALAEAHRMTPMVGRTHGVHAEPITFGLKCLRFSETLGRDLGRLDTALEGCAVGKFSGAVGTLAHLSPEVEARALERLGLAVEPVASQVVQRDRHAALLAMIAVAGGTLEGIALEIRHLQRTEVGEAAECFRSKQKGSSAMPHKRNPVRCERVCGMARLLRAYAQTAFEDQALWHERDISHSSAERVVIPDAFMVADFMASELADVLAGLYVDPARMRENLDAGGGLVFSQRVLLALTDAGLARDDAYRIVQSHALRAADGGAAFRDALAADPEVASRLPGERLAACFDLDPFFRNVDAIFARAGRPDA